MRYLPYLLLSMVLAVATAYADNGLVTVKSAHSVKVTADRLEKALKNKGMTIFTRVDHAAGARKAGLELRPTELIIFGNPKVGTPLMQCSQTAGIDLPQKMLIWKDAAGQVWLSYNRAEYIQQRHKAEKCNAVIAKTGKALANFGKLATKP